MASEKIEIETFFGRCRCCLSYGYLKNMWTEHEFEGDTEIYGEMLVQCFALAFQHSEEAMEHDQICEQCISRLRDASDFKKVVLDSQEELLQQEEENDPIIKEEIEDDKFLMVYKDPDSEGDTADTGDTSESIKDEMEYQEIEYQEIEYQEIEYLEEDDVGESKEGIVTDSSLPTVNRTRTVKRRKKAPSPDPDEGSIKRKWPKRLPKAERLKTYKQYSEEDLRQCLEAVRNNELTPSEASLKYNIPKKTVCAKMRMDPKDAQWIKNTAETEDGNTNAPEISRALKNALKVTRARKNAPKIGKRQRNQNILSEFKENARTILKFSNATPIRGHWGIGYACIYCKYQNALPSELKNHTLTTHSENVDELDNVKYVSDMIIKLDITDLRCKLCDKKMDSLEDIMEHLKYIHEQPMHLDINNHIVPFKFEKTFLECALCPKQFNYFKQISEHMNQHYPNYACSKCDRHFINTRSLRTHLNRHQTGTFVCSYCPKIFDTRIKMKEHERVLHLNGSKTRKCGYCDEKFMDTLRKTEHEVKEHGRPVPKFECKACGKCFDSQRSLKDHTNHFHLLLRPHTCPECNKGFYNKNEMKRHMLKHSKIKEFQCMICSKWYVTRSSLKSHMKLHENVEAYSCKMCGQVFVQKKTWVRHMEQHAESVKNAENAENLQSDADPNREKAYQLIKEIKAILSYTNATPYKSKNIRYYCAYCSTDGPYFEDPDDLRTHTRSVHVSTRTEKIEYAMRPYWMNEVLKLDIDNLLCTVCCIVINNWNEMFKHLKEKHNVILDQAYTRVIPYILKPDLKCALCKESFTNYLHLDGHMNAHYNNYVCDDCGDTFLAQNRLKQHVKIHNIGKYPCSMCEKVFTLPKYRRKHEDLVHEQLSKFKCIYCAEKFTGEYIRHLHCLEMHKDKIKIITCELCGKTFTWRQYYMNHMRKKHNHNKKFECGHCEKKFFTHNELKEHLLRHEGTKNFECEICHKKYVSMTSLKQHGKQHRKKQA